jgi:hypothetical protein
MEFLYLYIQQKSSIPLGGPLFLQDSVLPYCSYRKCTGSLLCQARALVVTITDVHYIFVFIITLLDSMEKTYDADISLALYLEKNSFKHMCWL